MVMNPEVNAGIEGYSDDDVTHAIFSGNNEGLHPEEGAMIVAPRNGGNHIYLFQTGEKGGYRLSVADMKIVGTYQDCFREGIEDPGFEGFALWNGSKEYLVNKGSIYFSDSNTSGIYSQYDVRCFGEPYDAAPYIGGNVTARGLLGSAVLLLRQAEQSLPVSSTFSPTVKGFTNVGQRPSIRKNRWKTKPRWSMPRWVIRATFTLLSCSSPGIRPCGSSTPWT